MSDAVVDTPISPNSQATDGPDPAFVAAYMAMIATQAASATAVPLSPSKAPTEHTMKRGAALDPAARFGISVLADLKEVLHGLDEWTLHHGDHLAEDD